MPTQGPLGPGTAFGFTGWTTVTKALAQDASGTDDSDAAVGPSVSSGNSTVLRLTNFGFNVPTDATITNLNVKVYGRRISEAPVATLQRYQIYLSGLKGSVLTSENNLSTEYEGSVFSEISGDPDSSWGYALTPTEVNSSTFGINYAYGPVASGTEQTGIDYMEVTLTYTLPGGGSGIDKNGLVPYILGDE